MLGYANLFQFAAPENQHGMRAGDIGFTLSDTLNRLDVPPGGAHPARRSRQRQGRDAGERAARRLLPRRIRYERRHAALTALELRVAGRTFGAIWFRRAPGAEHGAYYALDGSPLEAAAFTMPVKWTRISSFSANAFTRCRRRWRSTRASICRAERHARRCGGRRRRLVRRHRSGRLRPLRDRRSCRWLPTYYAHLSAFAHGLKTGETVKQGQRIGSVGMTGAATQPAPALRGARRQQSGRSARHARERADGAVRHAAHRLPPGSGAMALPSRLDSYGAVRVRAERRAAWGDFATDSSTLRAVFNTHYSAS